MHTPARPLRFVCHNVYWFQGAPYSGKEPVGHHAEVFRRLTAVYAELAPDVLCLQEVHESALARELGQALDMHVGHCPGGHEPQYGAALLWRGDGQYQDWRDSDQQPHRIWQQLDLNNAGTQAPLRIMNVHLPSNRDRTGEQGRQQRIASIEQILTREPDVVMGDFNARPEAPELASLREAGYIDVAAHMGLGHLGTAGNTKRIDYAWVRESLAHRLHHFDVVHLLDPAHQPEDENKTALSDHWPLCVELDAASASTDVPDHERRNVKEAEA